MIDTTHGDWRFDKRAFQAGVPSDAPQPPACALETTWVRRTPSRRQPARAPSAERRAPSGVRTLPASQVTVALRLPALADAISGARSG